MKFPAVLKIGGQMISIKVTDEVPNDNNGYWDSRKGTIYIHKNMPATEQEVTLLHEIIHALNNSIDHKEVEYLAQGLYQVIKDNSLIFDGKEAGK